MLRSSIFVVVSTAALLVGCGGGNPGTPDAGDPATTCDESAADVTTQQLFTDVVQPKCIDTCHTATGTAAGSGRWETAAELQMRVGQDSTYQASAESTLKVIEANNPANSTFLLKTLGSSPQIRGPKGESIGAQMPAAPNSPLSTEEQRKIRDWICGGAN